MFCQWHMLQVHGDTFTSAVYVNTTATASAVQDGMWPWDKTGEQSTTGPGPDPCLRMSGSDMQEVILIQILNRAHFWCLDHFYVKHRNKEENKKLIWAVHKILCFQIFNVLLVLICCFQSSLTFMITMCISLHNNHAYGIGNICTQKEGRMNVVFMVLLH